MRAIRAKNLWKRYWFYEKEGGLKGSFKNLFHAHKVVIEAVKGIDLEADIGEIIGFIGPNGAGKTTTLKMLAGILYPTSGEIEVMGFVPYKREKGFLSQITFLSGQRNTLFWDLPANEYFNFCRLVYKIPEKNYLENLKKLVQLAEIEDILHVPQRKLSFGQRKRCEFVAAMLHDPKVIFLDEPTNALDLINARRMREFIKEKAKEGKYTFLITSHNMADIEQICQRVIIINMGKIIYDGPIGHLNRLNGFPKKIKIIFNGNWDRGEMEKFGRIIHYNGAEVSMEVSAEEAAKVAGQLFSQYPIKDISIEDPSLETIIEAIYKKSL